MHAMFETSFDSMLEAILGHILYKYKDKMKTKFYSRNKFGTALVMEFSTALIYVRYGGKGLSTARNGWLEAEGQAWWVGGAGGVGR